MSEATIFAAALDKADPQERAAYLDEACAGDAKLRRRVEALLKAHAEPDEVLDAPAQRTGTIDYQPIAERVGTKIGPYKLMEQIGEGGFGLVFVAEQQEPVKRKVALKVIKPGMDTREVMARFTAERQALALMDHPNIARVLDAGATDSGRPYFVMELVRGIPITDYCDQNQLSPRDRLDLFITVCQAVQHAHQKGIIHRDIKPSNVLVTSHDGKPVAKVIDFGVAKAINQQLTERTIYTNFAQMIGTPLYMSPEQAEMSGLDIDTRSDIYSLGVLLYELLTGTTPLDQKRFAKAAYDEIRRMIREDEPQKPSTRLSTSDSIASIAAQRHVEPAKLSKLMRGDLDWITMKALEKDRTRRYETANGLARDIQRYLQDEPVEASPPSTLYRFGKWYRKNRVPTFLVLFVTACGAAVLINHFIASYHIRRERDHAIAAAEAEKQQRAEAEKQRDRAVNAEHDAQVEKKRADEEATVAKSERARAENEKQIAFAVQDFLQNDLLGQADARHQANMLLRAGRSATEVSLNPTIRQLLDRAARALSPDRIETSFPNQPLVQAEILRTLGDTYLGIGEYDQAIGFLQRAAAIHRQQHGPASRNTLSSMNNLAVAYRDAGKRDLSVPLLEETFKLRKKHLGPEDKDTLQSMNNLANAYHDAGKLDLALPLYVETLKLTRTQLGGEHVETFVSMNNLAAAYRDAGKLDQALSIYEETHRLTKAKLGPEHPYTLFTMNALALAYQDCRKLDLALPLYKEALRLQIKKIGPDHPHTLQSMTSLAMGYQEAGKQELALPLLEETLKIRKEKYGSEHPLTLESMNNLAATYWEENKLDKAIPLFEETVKRQEAKFGRDHPDTMGTVANLGVNYKDAGRVAEAVSLLEEAYRASKKYPKLRFVGVQLLNGYYLAGKNESAATLLKELLADARTQSPKDSPELGGQLARLGTILLEANHFTEAESLLRESLAIGEKKEPEDWRTFDTKFKLGGATIGQKKYADAEPLLLAGHEGMKQRYDKIARRGKLRFRESVERLVQLYEELDKKDEAAKWKNELNQLNKPAVSPPAVKP